MELTKDSVEYHAAVPAAQRAQAEAEAGAGVGTEARAGAEAEAGAQSPAGISAATEQKTEA